MDSFVKRLSRDYNRSRKNSGTMIVDVSLDCVDCEFFHDFPLCCVVSHISIIVHASDTLGQWNPFSTNFFPLFHNVGVLPFGLWVADTVTSFVNATAYDPLTICIVAYQVAVAGCGFFDLSYFVRFHNLFSLC